MLGPMVVVDIFHWLGWTHCTVEDYLALITEIMVKSGINPKEILMMAFIAILLAIILPLIGIVLYKFGSICNCVSEKFSRGF